VIVNAGGDVTGTTFSDGAVIVNAGGDVQLIINAAPGSSVTAGGTASVQNVGSSPVEVNGERQQNTRLTSVSNNQIVPTDSALPRQSNVPAAPPAGGGGREIQAAAESAGDALDQGFAVEIDLTPGPKKRK
jgi:hypothetical protein